MKSPRVRCARIYDQVPSGDGVRVLVDRLWPRGTSKDSPALDEWLKDAAPSTELRRWYGHDPAKYAGFRDRYLQELDTPRGREAVDRLRELAAQGTLILLTAGKYLALSHVQVLADVLAGEGPHPVAESDAGPSGEPDGDPACWLARVCPECGRLADQTPPVTCKECGAAIPAG